MGGHKLRQSMRPHTKADVRVENDLLLRENQRLAEKVEALIREKNRLEEEGKELEKLIITDPLTQIGNRRMLDHAVRIIRTHQPRNHRTDKAASCVMMLDVDHFKSINDKMGHTVGDQVLVQVASFLKARTRELDECIRYSGDEFVVVFGGATSEDVMNRFRMSHKAAKLIVPATVIRDGKEQSLDVSLSCGISECDPAADPATALFDAIEAADKEMYAVKPEKREEE